MELTATIGRTVGFSFAAGINLYATVAMLGLVARSEWVALPPQFQAFNNDIVIGVAAVMYAIEFVVDKVPLLDSIWDVIHTAIRPVGAALIAMTILGEASPTMEGLSALLGGAVAGSSHLTKASARAVANTQPEPLSNWLLSIGEDFLVLGLGYLALRYPLAALVVCIVLLSLMAFFATVIISTVRRWFQRPHAML